MFSYNRFFSGCHYRSSWQGSTRTLHLHQSECRPDIPFTHDRSVLAGLHSGVYGVLGYWKRILWQSWKPSKHGDLYILGKVLHQMTNDKRPDDFLNEQLIPGEQVPGDKVPGSVPTQSQPGPARIPPRPKPVQPCSLNSAKKNVIIYVEELPFAVALSLYLSV